MERKRGLPNYPGSRSLHIKLTLLITLEALSIIAQAFFLARAITLLFDGNALTAVMSDVVLFLIAFAVRYGLEQVQLYLAEGFAEKTGTKLREELMNNYFVNHSETLHNEGTGRLVTLAIDGIDQLKAYLEIISIRTIKTLIVPLILVAVVAYFDLISAVILVVTVPVVIIFMILLGKAAQFMADRQYDTYLVLSNHFIDSLKGLETLSYLGKSKAHAERIEAASENYRKATMKTLSFAFLSSFALDFFTSLSIAFVAVGLGLRLIDGVILLFPALLILILAPEYYTPIKQVGQDFHATLDGQLAMNDIDSFVEKSKAIKVGRTDSLLWKKTSELSLQGVDLTIDDKLILNDIHYQFPSKGMIGLVGSSGAGKSSLINLLAGRSDPSRGQIKVNERTVETLHDEAWFENIAYIPQSPYIFPMSILENIRFYEKDASRSDVLTVIEKIGLNELVSGLPNGIDELIGEGGRYLSGGQEQRIAMARALLSDKPIILLDEPTAHLDIETEYEIKHEMLSVFKNKLMIIATHRLHWMPHLDDILVLENGELVAHGSDEVLRANEAYARLRNRQKEGLNG